jgi:integrase
VIRPERAISSCTKSAGQPEFDADHQEALKRRRKPSVSFTGAPVRGRHAGRADVKLYALRHTCATLLLIADVPAKVVSERLGHSSAPATGVEMTQGMDS